MAAKAKADTHPKKIDLSLGTYRDDHGQPRLLRAVRLAKQQMVADEKELEEYLPLEGHEKFAQEARDLLFLGEDNKDRYAELCERICSYHCGSCINALYSAMVLYRENVPLAKKAYASDPCYANYERMCLTAGFEFGMHPYFTSVEKGIDFEEMIEALKTYEKGSLIILQASCHNPTGFDLTPEQWVQVRDVLFEKELIPLIDIAYQGLGSGDMKRDSLVVRIFLEKDMDFFVAQSFSKNMSLYSARVGVLHCVYKSDYINKRHMLMRNLTLMSRARFGSAERHGPEIAYRLMSDPSLRKMWLDELQGMTGRLINMRQELRNRLEAKKVKGTWKHITEQIGMFAYLGISQEAVERLQEEFHIYMMLDGRISIAGLNPDNIDYFVDALCSVLGQQH